MTSLLSQFVRIRNFVVTIVSSIINDKIGPIASYLVLPIVAIFYAIEYLFRPVMFVYAFNWLVISLEFWILICHIVVSFVTSIYREFNPKPKKNVSGKIVLITGAGKGLGREMSLRFAKQGAIMVLWDIDKDRCERTGREVRSVGGKAHVYQVDVGDYGKVMSCADRVKEEVGHVDILINNAAIVKVQPFLDIQPSCARKTMNVNLMSHFWTIKAYLPEMIQRNSGHIVAISSNLGIAGKSHFTDYCASKFGVHGLMSSLAAELHEMRKFGIVLTIACPAAINSGLVKTIETRFPRIFPLLETSVAAKSIIDSILRNESLVILPWGYRWLYAFLRNSPQKVAHLMEDYLGNTTEID